MCIRDRVWEAEISVSGGTSRILGGAGSLELLKDEVDRILVSGRRVWSFTDENVGGCRRHCGIRGCHVHAWHGGVAGTHHPSGAGGFLCGRQGRCKPSGGKESRRRLPPTPPCHHRPGLPTNASPR